MTDFRKRLLAGELMMGSFVKTPATHTIEVLGDIGFDFVVIDEEHAPFDRGTIDRAILAARASGTSPIVRVAGADPSKLLAVLDDGAEGVLIPHVYSAEIARKAVSACRYRSGSRGISNTTRAGGYGRLGLWEHVDIQDAAVTVIAMIEDPQALDAIDDIVATDGLDAVFVGRGDLAVAMGAEGQNAPDVLAATARIIEAAKAAGKPAIIMVGSAKEGQSFLKDGFNGFIIGSDHSFMRQAAIPALKAFSELRPQPKQEDASHG